ncbi:protein late bloomer-like isoform X2 [Scaptodrosophila lebanonensis]|uniref:Protein late bloomer-like isoform X2 n=1 Tax=Drosophila lebanonensis TaxID=7225 RepID=A0A6J2ULD3_DROLE|nr:protein late bloomer-like isoform X2 [Scaptodrosophila lebanonensis]
MCQDIFDLKAESLFLNCLCCVGGLIKFAAAVANMKYAGGLDGLYIAVLVIRIFVSLGIFGIGIFGYYSILSDYVRGLWLYMALMVVFTALDASMLTLYIFNEQEINDRLISRIYATEELREIEGLYKCCGKTGIDEYIKEQKEVPSSCYNDDPLLRRVVLERDGCDLKLNEYFQQKKSRTLFVFWVFVVVQVHIY